LPDRDEDMSATGKRHDFLVDYELGFGGKETQGNQFAALAAIAAKKLGRAIKFLPDRDEDMSATGKRHDFLVDYELGF
ncbi:molybdopterin cofactor-binding domain-containing protein, partial [Rhizobium leguminosarum]|uniref:molybdopterin cofactor-binding domain-containing protein n=1 Tax=Rhizobium leguminosarum TaxID=384 RepID=UPI003F989492